MKTKPVYGNCLLGGMYLCLRGNVKKVILISSHNRFVPGHIMVKTKRNVLLHFRYIVPQKPLYFKGYFEAIPLSKAQRYLESDKRKVLYESTPLKFFFIALLLSFILFPIFCASFPLHLAIFRIPLDLVELFKRRYKNTPKKIKCLKKKNCC